MNRIQLEVNVAMVFMIVNQHHIVELHFKSKTLYFFLIRVSDVYYEDPRRNYGQSVTTIFYKLKNKVIEDVFGPAREQFDGLGSCGNGSAMRVVPAGLIGLNDDSILTKVRMISEPI